MYDTVASAFQEQSDKLANMYDAEMKEKEASIAEAKQALSDFEAQRHKIRQESYALMAQIEDENKVQVLRQEYESCLRGTESFLEQKEHSGLQREILQQDQQAPSRAFRSANSIPLSHDEMRSALPWAIELFRQQDSRRQQVREIARLMGDAGTSEKVGTHRKLVAIATGLKEDELDSMSGELLESLEATQGGATANAHTPPHVMAGLEVA